MCNSGQDPILYSFRRCPYAMRARMAIHYAQTRVELREVQLKSKPREMLDCSPKGTVPVLVLPDGRVIDESMDIIHWALAIQDPDNWALMGDNKARQQANQIIALNDSDFKRWLDCYKYADRFPEKPAAYYRSEGEIYLRQLDDLLLQQAYLVSQHVSYADIAIMPFIRQFACVDINWFDQSSYAGVQRWLDNLLHADLFIKVMQKYTPWNREQKTML